MIGADVPTNTEGDFDATMSRHFGPTRYKEMHRVTLVHQAIEKHPYIPQGCDQQGRLLDGIRHAEGEIWRDVPGYEGIYSISNLGRVYSHKRVLMGPRGAQSYGGKLKATRKDWKGYSKIELSRFDEKKTYSVHRLVLLAFVGPAPSRMEACHCDGDPANNNLSNLRWDTRSNNNLDKRAHGTATEGETHPAARLTEEQVEAIRSDSRLQRVIAAAYGVVRQTIGDIKSGRRWKSTAPTNLGAKND